MSSQKSRAKRAVTELGTLLRDWRDMRGKNQIDLSLDTGVSQRYISFIESGRSVPSRQTLMDIAEALDIPLRDRNTLLLAAGYAPIYSEGAWNAKEMRSVTRAIERILRQHEPFPAVVMDRYWNVLMTNGAAPHFFSCFIDMAARKGPRNLLHLMFDPQGMRPFVVNWEELAKSLIQRVHRESVGRVIDEKTKELLGALLAYPDVKDEWKSPKVRATAALTPLIPYSFIKQGRVLNYFSMWVEATPALYEDGWAQVDFTYYEERRGQRHRVGGGTSGMLTRRPDGSPELRRRRGHAEWWKQHVCDLHDDEGVRRGMSE